MSKVQKLLFVCYQNRARSVTAEKILRGCRGYAVKSAGTAQGAKNHVNQSHIRWADQIFVMEELQGRLLREQFADLLGNKPLICLHIPDRYQPMHPALIDRLKKALSQHLDMPDLKAV